MKGDMVEGPVDYVSRDEWLVQVLDQVRSADTPGLQVSL